jgi:hypothetical protein
MLKMLHASSVLPSKGLEVAHAKISFKNCHALHYVCVGVCVCVCV